MRDRSAGGGVPALDGLTQEVRAPGGEKDVECGVLLDRRP